MEIKEHIPNVMIITVHNDSEAPLGILSTSGTVVNMFGTDKYTVLCLTGKLWDVFSWIGFRKLNAL